MDEPLPTYDDVLQEEEDIITVYGKSYARVQDYYPVAPPRCDCEMLISYRDIGGTTIEYTLCKVCHETAMLRGDEIGQIPLEEGRCDICGCVMP